MEKNKLNRYLDPDAKPLKFRWFGTEVLDVEEVSEAALILLHRNIARLRDADVQPDKP